MTINNENVQFSGRLTLLRWELQLQHCQHDDLRNGKFELCVAHYYHQATYGADTQKHMESHTFDLKITVGDRKNRKKFGSAYYINNECNPIVNKSSASLWCSKVAAFGAANLKGVKW